MKSKIFLPIVFLVLSLFSVTAFADEVYTLETKIPLGNGEISINTQGGYHMQDCRCSASRTITIKEDKPGLLKEGKRIYLKMDEGIFPDGVNITTSDKDIDVRYDDSVWDNIMIIELKKMNHKKALEIKMSTNCYYDRKNIDWDNPLYGISLIGGKHYEDNLFSELSNEEIVLHHEFLDMRSRNFKVTNVKTLTLTANENNVLFQKETVNIDTHAYLKENNYLMLPVRQCLEAVGLGSVSWEQSNGCAIIKLPKKTIALQPKEGKMNINDVEVKLSTPILVNNGIIFINSDDFGPMLGLSDDEILYSQDKKTVTFVIPQTLWEVNL